MPTPTVSRLTLADGPAYFVPIVGPSARPALEWIAARYTSAEVLADGARWVPGAVIVPQSVAATYCHELAAENGNPTQDVPACAGGPLADSLRALRSAMLADLGNPWAPCPALPADVVTGRHPSILPVPDAMGYRVYAVTDDGGTLCERCAADPANPCHPAGVSGDGAGAPFDGDGWTVIAWGHSGDSDGPLDCDHCGAVIIDGDDQ